MNLAFILGIGTALFSAGLGLTAAFRAGHSLPRWTFGAGMVLLAIECLCSGFATEARSPETLVHWQTAGLFAMVLQPAVWLFFSLTYARGNPREFVRKWRLVLLAALLGPLIIASLWHDKLISAVAVPTPGKWLLQLARPGQALHLVLLLATVVVLMNLERTFRASVGTMRWRIKFMILGLGVLFAVRAYTSSQVLLFHSIDLSLQALNSAALLVGCLLIGRSLLRAGHFEVGVFPSHSVLHNSLTVLLAGIYLILVGVFAKLVSFFGGATAFELKAFLVLVALVLLALVLLSDRVRLYTRRFVSRHFQRPVYDYRSVWRTFTEATTRRVETADLCAAVAKAVSQVFQALSITVWLLDDKGQNLVFAASTSLSEAEAGRIKLDPSELAQVLPALRTHPGPVDIDSSKEVWVVILRRLHPDEFRKGGNRVCVPLLAGGELLGVMMLGDRVGAVPYSIQDFDLLQSVSDQAAANLLNIRLSHSLTQAKQLEAFQMMSAFFVHDLKNTASTLSLMLQNLPIHFNDPAFREDALRGISRTVAHINELIESLSLLRKEITIHPVESDLNELVSAALKGLEAGQGSGGKSQRSEIGGKGTPARAELVQDLRPVPGVLVDPAQIQNVVVNLVLNARDAVGTAGRIRVETGQRDGWAVLTVADNGCGMTPDFVQRSLFRPFQTTKKKGIGIGMFQCQTIIEAHRGKIEVESELGKGTSFHVLLPLRS